MLQCIAVYRSVGGLRDLCLYVCMHVRVRVCLSMCVTTCLSLSLLDDYICIFIETDMIYMYAHIYVLDCTQGRGYAMGSCAYI